jgi:DNA-binding NarL/FixJ family response regulator
MIAAPSLGSVEILDARIDQLAEQAAAAARDAGWERTEVRALWHRLLEGRCRLIAAFDRDGRRHFVIREQDATPLASLDYREQRLAELLGSGQSEKAVAYTLGVTPSAVSAALKSTLAKLGVASRADLVFLVRSMRTAAAA